MGRGSRASRKTSIEHIVARSEAHDSGPRAASPTVRKRFASDLLNLTLASPSVNRHQKSDMDASDWLPDLNQCWHKAAIYIKKAPGYHPEENSKELQTSHHKELCKAHELENSARYHDPPSLRHDFHRMMEEPLKTTRPSGP